MKAVSNPSTTPLKAKRRRRSKVVSIEAQLRQQAKSIYETGMVEAVRVATLGLILKKQDEITALLRAAGIEQHSVVRVVGGTAPAPAPRAPVYDGPTCFQCGRPATRKSRPNKFNPTGSWACQVHEVLLAKSESEDRVDASFMLNQEPMPGPKQQGIKQVIQAPSSGGGAHLDPAPEPVPVADGLGAAMAALGQGES